MKLETKQGVLIIAAVAILAIIGIVYYVWGPSLYGGGNHGPAAVFAPKGQLTSGLPQDLIIDPQGSTITNSYSINYGTNGYQYTATYHSSLRPDSLYGAYGVYFIKNSWTIKRTSSPSATSTVGGIYAVKASTTASVAITPDGTSSEVTVSYLNNP